MKKLFCAHRGVSALMPENTLPSFAAALALGADEIEFDVRLTKDGKMVVSHDGTLERISNGEGKVAEHTLDELLKLNIGLKHGWEVPFYTPEDVFALLANKIVFNIHIKEHGEDGVLVKMLAELAEKYNCADNIYIAASPEQLEWAQKIAPHIRRCAIQLPRDTMRIRDIALTYGCSRVQFWLGMFDEALINQLHEDGILCNLYFADTEEDIEKYYGMGIDNLLTNRMDIAAAWRKKA